MLNQTSFPQTYDPTTLPVLILDQHGEIVFITELLRPFAKRLLRDLKGCDVYARLYSGECGDLCGSFPIADYPYVRGRRIDCDNGDLFAFFLFRTDALCRSFPPRRPLADPVGERQFGDCVGRFLAYLRRSDQDGAKRELYDLIRLWQLRFVFGEMLTGRVLPRHIALSAILREVFFTFGRALFARCGEPLLTEDECRAVVVADASCAYLLLSLSITVLLESGADAILARLRRDKEGVYVCFSALCPPLGIEQGKSTPTVAFCQTVARYGNLAFTVRRDDNTVRTEVFLRYVRDGGHYLKEPEIYYISDAKNLLRNLFLRFLRPVYKEESE